MSGKYFRFGQYQSERQSHSSELFYCRIRNIQAADLQAENTDASISGSGNISCYASQKLVARVKGSGDIAYKGDPQEVDAPRKNIRQIK